MRGSWASASEKRTPLPADGLVVHIWLSSMQGEVMLVNHLRLVLMEMEMHWMK
jgi:hypothetical protein